MSEVTGPPNPPESKGSIDPSSQKIIKSESEYIRAWRKRRNSTKEIPEEKTQKRPYIQGWKEPEVPSSSDETKLEENFIELGLSGGGIRSATFCLGVMQALAEKNLFKNIDYLSTVSGGGYIGSAITWLKSPMSDPENKKYFEDPKDFPFGTGDEKIIPDNKKPSSKEEYKEDLKARLLKFLRGHGNYLTPGGGIKTQSLIAVFLRGTLLTVLVWFLLFLALMLFVISWSKMWVESMSCSGIFGCTMSTPTSTCGLEANPTLFCHLTQYLCMSSNESGPRVVFS